MRIAFIMLCHKDPDQINSLVNKLLQFSDADVFIHLDLNHSNIQGQIAKREGVFFVPEEESYYVSWGSLEIVQATLQLIREVKKQEKRYDYVWLISGQDYPICSVMEIENRLGKNPGMNYIETILPGNKRYNWYKKLYEVAYPSWINRDTFIVKVYKRLFKLLTGGQQHTFGLFRRKKPFSYDFVFGSQWWALTYDAVMEILQYSDEHPEVLEYYRKSIVPDESFFQTLFARGPFMGKNMKNLTFINWGKNHRSPELLTERDGKKIIEASREFCFARKFSSLESSELISIIDSYVAAE